MKDFSVRLAESEDAQRVWEINNSRDVRAVSVNPEPIPWDDHLNWFESALSSTDRFLYVVVKDDRTLGVLRFDRSPTPASFEISIALSAESRGLGVGTEVLSSAFQYGPAEMEHIIAHVRPDNAASIKAFLRAGFEISGASEKADVDLIRMERSSSVQTP